MALDFTKLSGIAYRGCESEAARASRDELVEQGFTILEGESTPFDEPSKPPQQPQETKRPLPPLRSYDGGRDYRRFYRLACNFHEKYNPPRLSDDYWTEVCDEMCRITAEDMGNDPFGMALLLAVFDELEAEYKRIAHKAENGPRSLPKAAEGQK